MRPSEETKALQSLRAIKHTRWAELEGLVLDTLARDEQDASAHDRPTDIVHRTAYKACENLNAAADALNRTSNACKWLAEQQPDTEVHRVASIPDCLACGNLALPRPRGGMCDKCRKKCARRTRKKYPDRAGWIASRKISSVPTPSQQDKDAKRKNAAS